MAKKVVLAGACRTAIGTMGGTLSTTPAPELGAIVIKEALKRAGVAPEAVDQVYMGCVIQAGQGQNVARQAAIKAGLPIEVPAVTMNVVCGSGLNCVNQAAQMIMAGDADVVVAGGMENMSMAPYAIPQGRYGYRMGNATMVDTMIKDALWDAFNDYHMIKTADNICEEWGLTREELDEFALKSQLKAEEAQKNGAFKAEIVPVEVKKKKETIVFDTDEGPRHGSTIEGLAKLRAINPGGFVTAGNASGINDGAAAIVVMSEEKAKLIKDLKQDILDLPKKIEETLKCNEEIKKFAQKMYQEKDVFFLGRGIDETVAKEGSLKLKEISYIHSESYAAGELKHGPIALIENGITVISIMTDENLVKKTVSNIQEVITRGAKTLVVTNQDIDKNMFDEVITIPKTNCFVSPILSIIPLQLLAYYISKVVPTQLIAYFATLHRGLDIDKPRNLAKSVTVE